MDNLLENAVLGLVIPKRLAPKSVTRNALKRQVRAVAQLHAAQLAVGAWVVRLHAPFDRKLFLSASSIGLKNAARLELQQLLPLAISRLAKAAVGGRPR